MQRSRTFAVCLWLASAGCLAVRGQVVAPEDLKDRSLSVLQERYMQELTAVGEQARGLRPPYHFYLGRRLDIEEKRQRRGDQRSIRFGRYQGLVVLEITGNYYAAYSRELMNREQRAERTFTEIALPLLKSAVLQFQDNPEVEAYAVEVSHHVLATVWGITVESPENLFVLLPQATVRRVFAAPTREQRKAILSQLEVQLNGQPVLLTPALLERLAQAFPDF